MNSLAALLSIFAVTTGVVYSCPVGCKCSVLSVSCTNMDLVSLPDGISPDTDSLDLSGNMIEVITPKLFAKFEKLHTLKLRQNNIKAIDRSSFYGLYTLKYLSLQHNELTTIGEDTFSHNSDLVLLDISSNRLSDLPSNCFTGLDKLRVLNLRQNKFGTIKNYWFGSLPSLAMLDLSESFISRIESASFDGMTNLKVLSIQYNELSSITPGTIDALGELQFLFMDNNAHLDCTCSLIKEVNKIKQKEEHDIKGWCAKPPDLFDRELNSIKVSEVATNC